MNAYDKIAVRPRASDAGPTIEIEPRDMETYRGAHEALLALARLLGRQAAIEAMRSDPSTSVPLQQRTRP
jgi:hypothetical protein